MTPARFETDIVIVGAGPAGLAAGLAARQAGAHVLVVDALPKPGGQYFMQPADGLTEVDDRARAGRHAIRAAQEAGVAFLTGTEIFAAYPGFSLFGTGI